MAYFLAAYLVVWLAVLMYVGRLGAKQRELAARLELLEEATADQRRKAA